MGKKARKGISGRQASWDPVIHQEVKLWRVYWKSPDYPFRGNLDVTFTNELHAQTAAAEHQRKYPQDSVAVYRILNQVTGVLVPPRPVRLKKNKLLRTLALCAGINPYGSVENEQARDAALELLKEMR